METRRLILMMIFSMSLIMLWDNYQASQGKPTLFGLSTNKPAETSGYAASSSGSTAAGANEGLPSPVAASKPEGSDVVPESVGVAPVKATDLVVSNGLLELKISTEGAQIVGSKLLKHPDALDQSKSVELFSKSVNSTYLGQFGVVGHEGAPNHRSQFELMPGDLTLDGKDRLDVKFRSSGGGLEVTYTYSLFKDRYDVQFKADVVNTGEQVAAPTVYMQLVRDDKPLATDSTFYSTFTGPALYTSEGKYQKVAFKDIASNKATFQKSSSDGWFGLIQHYFVSAVVPQGGNREYFLNNLGNGLYSVGAKSALGTVAPGQRVEYNATIYSGPQDQNTLEKLAKGLDLVVDYGWLTIVAKPIYWLLEKIYALVQNWGWSIILLTVVIKLIFFPLSAASYKSMAKMRVVGPRMQALKTQYGEDKMGFQRAMMDLYKREKINPLGGCMPILIQIPVFIALYWVLLASVEMRNAPWLGWIHDLAAPDPFYILPVIMAITMFIQTKLNPTPPDPIQAKVMMIMPLVFSFMFIFFPSGLVLYWVVNNILSIAQQWVITRQIEMAPAGKA